MSRRGDRGAYADPPRRAVGFPAMALHRWGFIHIAAGADPDRDRTVGGSVPAGAVGCGPEAVDQLHTIFA